MMKQFKNVFKFELMGMLKSKNMIITTIVMAAIILVLTTVPSFIAWFDDGEDSEVAVDTEVSMESEEYHLVYDHAELEEELSSLLGGEVYSNEEDLKQAVLDEEVTAGFVIHDYNNYTYISYDRSLNSFEQMTFEEQLRSANEQRLFEQEGIDSAKVYEIMNTPINYENVTLGKDAGSGMAIAFAMIFIMYMLILLYGTNVATSVAREKDSRTMELLITATKPKTLILGKVAAAGTMGVLQVSALILTAFIGFMLNQTNYPDFLIEMIQGSMTVDTLLVYILFSVLGYILYLFIYASLGSLVSKVEDVSSAVAPITFLFVFAYLAATLAMQMPDNTIIKVTSFIPFVSLFTMPIRYMLTSVPLLSVLASSAIMIVTVLLFAALSIYIYRFGSLNYGNKIKLKEVIKSFKKQ
ncbi:ABC transporter permease [Jeotgalibaca sp. MA1X17-3]|uniref:ABC transporter permease n=1 Tax=Jeotgalibaca sp. MA1X17-3 TaxID=2908211 RepID=UPI001F1AEB1F|nr:ABC transporter permease [Jeotgalibaca sp. MA1X17-3]UJF15539.1 ABC transporter permease [Jeotgalibaca sp. MA1X17-3]